MAKLILLNTNLLNHGFLLQNGHTAQTIAKQLGRPAVLGALKRSCQIDSHQPLSV